MPFSLFTANTPFANRQANMARSVGINFGLNKVPPALMLANPFFKLSNMQFTARLDGIAQNLRVAVVASESVIRITGRDAHHPKSKYFDRRAGTENNPFSGLKIFDLPLPLAPQVLKVELTDELSGDSRDLRIEDLKVVDLKTYPLWIRPQTKAFMDFALQFCKEAGHIATGRYISDCRQFAIEYSPVIRNSKGEKMFTPARVSRSTGFMEISRLKFLEYTIPMRLLILLHERMHHEMNTSEEIEADLNALRVYLSYGFPATEAIYATANIFYDRPDMIERVKQIKQFILDFQRKSVKQIS